MKRIPILVLLAFAFQLCYCQYQIGIIPRQSPDKAVYQKIGYTEVEVRYGSPSVNNRKIWGDLVPYDKVWRAGANSASTVYFGTSVNMGGQTLDSGTYSFFLIPKRNDTWTVILNKVAKQWGAFKYDETEDVLRLEVRPRITNQKTEHLSYSLKQTGFSYGSILLSWDFREVEVPFETHYLEDFEREIEARAEKQPDYIQWIPYLQGAEHLTEIGKKPELATQWIDKAEKIMNETEEWNEQFYPRPYVEGHVYWTKAKISAWNKDYQQTVAYVDKLKAMDEPGFYERQNETESIDLLYKEWKKRL